MLRLIFSCSLLFSFTFLSAQETSKQPVIERASNTSWTLVKVGNVRIEARDKASDELLWQYRPAPDDGTDYTIWSAEVFNLSNYPRPVILLISSIGAKSYDVQIFDPADKGNEEKLYIMADGKLPQYEPIGSDKGKEKLKFSYSVETPISDKSMRDLFPEAKEYTQRVQFWPKTHSSPK